MDQGEMTFTAAADLAIPSKTTEAPISAFCRRFAGRLRQIVRRFDEQISCQNFLNVEFDAPSSLQAKPSGRLTQTHRNQRSRQRRRLSLYRHKTSTGGYAMIPVSSLGANDSARRAEPRGRLVELLSGHHVRATVAVLTLFGCLSLSDGAYAQTSSSTQAAASPEACLAKCKADDEQCYQNGSSEEMCAYDSKACKAACEKK